MINHIPAKGAPKQTVPLTVYVRNGHLVDRDEGGERFVIGTADVQGTTVSMTLNDFIDDKVRDALASGPDGSEFNIGFIPGTEVGVTWDVQS